MLSNQLRVFQLGAVMDLALILCATLALQACTTALPMHEWRVTEADVARIRNELGHDVPVEAIRNPHIDYQFEVTVPCTEMLRLCFGGLPWWQKALGSIPLACTKFWFHAWREQPLNNVVETAKTAIAYRCPLTPDFVMDHEREHLQGRMHP